MRTVTYLNKVNTIHTQKPFTCIIDYKGDEHLINLESITVIRPDSVYDRNTGKSFPEKYYQVLYLTNYTYVSGDKSGSITINEKTYQRLKSFLPMAIHTF